MDTEISDRLFHAFRPGEGHRLAHNPLNSIIAPRPIGWIATISKDGVANVAPFSFFNLFSYLPPVLGFSPDDRADSLRNARETGEFTWNLVSRDLAEQMNVTSMAVSPDVDEFELAGLETLASIDVAAPRVARSPVQMECKVTDIISVRGLDDRPGTHSLVLGEIIHVHIDEAHIVDGMYRTTSPIPILRGGGAADYFTITDSNCFQMPRPAQA